MQHMIVATHGPETCPASREEMREAYLPDFDRMAEIGKALEVEPQGGWADMPAHIIFLVVEAPNAHAVTQFAADLHLMDWNTVVVHPVIAVEQASARAGAREARA